MRTMSTSNLPSKDALKEAFRDPCCNVDVSGLRNFCLVNIELGRRLAIITSGGTQAQLEQKAVRHLENFSTGTRGAIATEAFLENTQGGEYAVVFLGREGSKLPFARLFASGDLSHARRFEKGASGDAVFLCDRDAASACEKLNEAFAAHRLLIMQFVTVQEYLYSLQLIAHECRALGDEVLFFLAAAVSDFYMPREMMSIHKLESRDGELVLKLPQVPKCLGLLRKEWAPNAYVISFKLETDEQKLVAKATASIQKYGVHGVVGNILDTRYNVVTFVTADNTAVIRRKGEDPIEIALIATVIDEHTAFLRGQFAP